MSDESERQAAITRLRRLPGVVNFARHNRRRLDETERRLQAFAARPPRHTLVPVGDICSGLATRSYDFDEAVKRIEQISSPVTRMAAREIIPAFASTMDEQSFDAVGELSDFELKYPIGRDTSGKLILIPIKPSFILLSERKLVPVFLIGWATLALDDFQKQLISSILTRSVLSHQYFIGSDARILCYPRIKRTKVRHPRSWLVTEYDLLSEEMLREQFERYTMALSRVLATLGA